MGGLTNYCFPLQRLPGWEAWWEDPSDVLTFTEALLASCDHLATAAEPQSSFSLPAVKEWTLFSQKVRHVLEKEETCQIACLKALFEKDLQVFKGGEKNEKGLFTGYYAPVLKGAFAPSDIYRYPIYRRPHDLILVEDLGAFKQRLQGERLAARLHHNALCPYWTREEIEKGALKDRGLEIAWVSSEVDLFLLHVQGSGFLELEDGTLTSVGYDGTNGHDYRSVGIRLKNEGLIEELSAERVAEWLEKNPEQRLAMLCHNPAFTFFKVKNQKKPIGTQGVPLTPRKSLAVDPCYIPLGSLMWVDIPFGEQVLNHFMLAQDTGGAIKGPIRGDYYWGIGPEAGHKAAHMHQQGTYYLLCPKTSESLAADKEPS